MGESLPSVYKALLSTRYKKTAENTDVTKGGLVPKELMLRHEQTDTERSDKRHSKWNSQSLRSAEEGGVSTNLQQLEAPLSRGLAVSTEGYVLGRIAVGLGQEWGMCPGQVRVLLAFSHHPSPKPIGSSLGS